MKLILHLAQLALKQILRHRMRSVLTILGVGSGMFLFTAVETMQQSLKAATQITAKDTTLVVYRENRFCPATSQLPEYYLSEILRIPGVREAIPIQIMVNNCGASLDVITFRGVPPDNLNIYNPDIDVIDGSYSDWTSRSDGALLGENFAARRGLAPGDQFEAVGVRVYVSGIIRSPLTQDNNVAYVHLSFLQQSSKVGLGTVTQFNVRVDSTDQLDNVSKAIDELFASDSKPTETRPEKAFFAQTASDMIEIIHFTRWLGAGAIIAVLGLVANALLLVARGRVKENAILQTLGFPRLSIALLMIWEGILLGLLGGMAGSISAGIFFYFRRFSFGNEGLTLSLNPSLQVILIGLLLAILLGLLASLWPAFDAARKPLIESLRN